MISVADATDIVLSHLFRPQVIALPLEKCMGKILEEDLLADRDFPPFDRVSMDGIALSYDAWKAGRREFPIRGTGAAGSPQVVLEDPDTCVEIMTGAMLPKGADAIVRYEDVDIAEGVARLGEVEVKPGQNVHVQGFDQRAGDIVVHKGSKISSAEIGVAASIGKTELRVASLPKAIIISSGDELVGVSEAPLHYQIRRSNAHQLRATLGSWGLEADLAHFPDNPEDIEQKLSEVMKQYDLVIISGGVSKGKFDYMPEALENLGVEKFFHRVKQRPGKPFWFGAVEGGPTVFALPGNPVSSFVCLLRYLQPWLRASLGQPPFETRYARLEAPIQFAPDLTYFAQVLLIQ